MEEKIYTTWSGRIADFLIGFFIVGALLGFALSLVAKGAGYDRLIAALVCVALAAVALASYLYRKRKYIGIGLFTLLACQGLSGSLLLGMMLTASRAKSEDLSSDPNYAYIVGHVFETTRDMIIVSWGIDTIMLDVPGEGGAPLVSELPRELPYKTDNKDIVLGVLPAGSRFQVVGVKGGWSTASGGYTTYTLRMKTPKEYRNWGLSDIGLISYDIKPRRFKKDRVREVVWNKRP